MEESRRILQHIREGLAAHERQLVGAVEIRDDVLFALDGKLSLQVQLQQNTGISNQIAHFHVVSRLGTASTSPALDACVVGMGADRASALKSLAERWVGAVGCVVFSLLHAKPVMGAVHFDGTQSWGLPDCHGFLGPIHARVSGKIDLTPALHDGLFDGVVALAPPGLLHICKVTLDADGRGGWKRVIEIDGHAARFEETAWSCSVEPPKQTVIATQYAVFHFADRPGAVDRQVRLDAAICEFVAVCKATGSTEGVTEILVERGHEPDVVERVANFAPVAFCRVLFGGIGATFSPDYVRIPPSGKPERRRLLHEPAFARSAALF